MKTQLLSTLSLVIVGCAASSTTSSEPQRTSKDALMAAHAQSTREAAPQKAAFE